MPKQPPRPKPPLTIDQLAERKYSDPELARRVAQLAKESGNHEAIEDGRLVLPSEQDALHHLARLDEEQAPKEEHA